MNVDLLRRIVGGKFRFDADPRDPASLAALAAVVDELHALHALGYVQKPVTSRNGLTRHGGYSVAIAPPTEAGKLALAALDG